MKARDFFLNDKAFNALSSARHAYKTYIDVLEEELMIFVVALEGYDETKKDELISAVRDVTGYRSEKAKNFVEKSPRNLYCNLKSDVSKKEAMCIKEKIAGAGGVVEIYSCYDRFENK